MRTASPALLPILRSGLQAQILLHVLTSGEGVTSAELARTLGAPEPTVSRETRRLLTSGLLRGEQIGRAILLHAAEKNPATAPLRQLLVVTYGPSHLIEQALAYVPNIEEAVIHGSWAARYHGEAGKAPGDVDLLIVGHPDRAQVDAALATVEPQIRREINVTYVSSERWQKQDDPFLATVRSRPHVRLGLGAER